MQKMNLLVQFTFVFYHSFCTFIFEYILIHILHLQDEDLDESIEDEARPKGLYDAFRRK